MARTLFTYEKITIVNSLNMETQIMIDVSLTNIICYYFKDLCVARYTHLCEVYNCVRLCVIGQWHILLDHWINNKPTRLLVIRTGNAKS